MSTLELAEPVPAEEAPRITADPAAAADAVTVATPPIVAPPGLVVLGDPDAPACADGGCW